MRRNYSNQSIVVFSLLLGLLAVSLAACSKNKPGAPAPTVPATSVPATISTRLAAPTLPLSLVSTATPVVEVHPTAKVTVNLNVRDGPAQTETQVGLLEAGSEIEVTGRSEDGRWLRIIYPAGPEGSGWVAADFVEINEGETLPIVTNPTQAAAVIANQATPRPAPPITLTPVPTLVITATTTLSATTPPPPYRLDLSLDPTTIRLPSCARLLVELQAVTDVRLNNTPLTIEAGRYIADVCPAANSVYTLVGTISDGQVITRTIQLAVLESTPTPPAELAAIPISTTAGCQTAMARLGTTRAPFCRFAPDGSRIAAPAADGSLWVIAVDGSAVAQVADFSGRFLVKGELVWSPDGESIAFSTTALDGSGSGVGVYQLSSAELIYFGPDARRSDTPESAAVNNAAWPRWTQDGRLLITWYVLGPDEPGVVSVLAPARYAPEGPAVLPGGTELVLSSGYRGQQVHPWKPGWVWRVGRSPSYEVAD